MLKIFFLRYFTSFNKWISFKFTFDETLDGIRLELANYSSGKFQPGDYLDIRELELSIKESCDYISLYGAECDRFFNADGKVKSEKLIEMYDSFEELIEKNIENLQDVRIELNGSFGEAGDAVC